MSDGTKIVIGLCLWIAKVALVLLLWRRTERQRARLWNWLKGQGWKAL